MHEKTRQKIYKDICEIPEIREVLIEKTKRKPLLVGERSRQQKFLLGQQSKISTSTIYITEDDLLVTAKLRKTVYSAKFIQLKSAIDRIISQHINEFNATHDNLTEIYNRRGFETEIKKKKSSHLTYCIADIDNFKQINDSNSHEFGDRVLQEFSIKLKEICFLLAEQRKAKIIFARYGGEEFVIAILSDHPSPNMPEEIRRATRGSVDGVEFRASLGFSEGNNSSYTKSTLQKLYKESDAALYKSKREGKDRTTQFSKIREKLGRIIEVDTKHKILTIDIGVNSGVTKEDKFNVYPHKYSGSEKFIIDDGRSKKPLGTYPKIKIGTITPFEIQDEICFCYLHSGNIKDLEHGDHLKLCDEFEEPFKPLANTDDLD